MAQHILAGADGKKFIVDDAALARFISEQGKPFVPDPYLEALAPMAKEEFTSLFANDAQTLVYGDVALTAFNKVAAARLAEYRRKNPGAL